MGALHKNKLAKLFLTNPDHLMGFGHSQLGFTAAPFAVGANKTKTNLMRWKGILEFCAKGIFYVLLY